MKFEIKITAMKLWSFMALALAVVLFVLKSPDAMNVIYLSFAAIGGKTALDVIKKGDK